MKSTYNVEFAGNQIESKEVIARAKKVWVDAGNKNRKVKDLKTMDLYLKPEENAVYYVFNEEESGSFPLYEYSLYSLIPNTCSEATNIGYYIPCRLCFGYLSKFRIYFWRNLREVSDSCGIPRLLSSFPNLSN